MDEENERLVYGDLLDFLDKAFPEESLERVSRFYMRLLNQKNSLLEAFIAFVLSNKGYTYDNPIPLEDFDEDRWIKDFSGIPVTGPRWKFPFPITAGSGWDYEFVRNDQKLVVTVLSGRPAGGFYPFDGTDGTFTTFAEELAKKYDDTRKEGTKKLFLATRESILKRGKEELENLVLEKALVGIDGLLNEFTDAVTEKETVKKRWGRIRDGILKNFKDSNPILKGTKEPKEEILSEIERGEGAELEFKETLVYDVEEDEKNEGLKFEHTKEICALTNAWGGKLIIGVDDDGNVIGLERDFQYLDNEAEFRERLSSVIKEQLSRNFMNEFVDISFERIEDKKICIVKVKQASEPKFFGRKEDFFARIETSKESLSGLERAKYIKSHF